MTIMTETITEIASDEHFEKFRCEFYSDMITSSGTFLFRKPDGILRRLKFENGLETIEVQNHFVKLFIGRVSR